jgi:hypothetical protein
MPAIPEGGTIPGSHLFTSGVTTDSKILEAVKSWPNRTDKHQLRSFLGLCTYYRRFISGFADIAKPLTRLTEERRIFEWSTETETACQALKKALCTTPVLGYPRPGEKFIVDTDAINVGISGILSHVQDSSEKIVAYFSKAERNYCFIRRELLAIVKTLEHLHKYLYGQEFHVRCVHGTPP